MLGPNMSFFGRQFKPQHPGCQKGEAGIQTQVFSLPMRPSPGILFLKMRSNIQGHSLTITDGEVKLRTRAGKSPSHTASMWMSKNESRAKRSILCPAPAGLSLCLLLPLLGVPSPGAVPSATPHPLFERAEASSNQGD